MEPSGGGTAASSLCSMPANVDEVLQTAASRLCSMSADAFDEVLFHLHGFEAADTFCGKRQGRVFKLDTLGLGYYTDTRQPVAVEILQLGSTCKELRAALLPVLLPIATSRYHATCKE